MSVFNKLFAHALVHHQHLIIQCSDEEWFKISGQDSEIRLHYFYDPYPNTRIHRMAPEEVNLNFRIRRMKINRPTVAIFKQGQDKWNRQDTAIFSMHPKNKTIYYY